MIENISKLTKTRLFLLDMDGTVYLGDKLLPGALDFIELLTARNIAYLFLTNNSSKHRGQYAEKLGHLGLPIGPDKIFTSGEATAIYLHREKPGAKIYLVGTPADRRSRGRANGPVGGPDLYDRRPALHRHRSGCSRCNHRAGVERRSATRRYSRRIPPTRLCDARFSRINHCFKTGSRVAR